MYRYAGGFRRMPLSLSGATSTRSICTRLKISWTLIIFGTWGAAWIAFLLSEHPAHADLSSAKMFKQPRRKNSFWNSCAKVWGFRDMQVPVGDRCFLQSCSNICLNLSIFRLTVPSSYRYVPSRKLMRYCLLSEKKNRYCERRSWNSSWSSYKTKCATLFLRTN